jgi:hypothetical protein
MAKIPVRKTIAYAYGFTFGNLLMVLGLSWAAAMIAMIVSASAFEYRSLVPAPEGTAAEFA